MVAKPHSPDKATVREVQGTKIAGLYRVMHGRKTGDFEAAARLIQGQELKVDTFVVPATTEIGQRMKTRSTDKPSGTSSNKPAQMGLPSCAAFSADPPTPLVVYKR